jgi:hypothetical protein
MDHVIEWDTLVGYYGPEFAQYKDGLKKAGWQTNAVLACRWSASDKVSFKNVSGDHAEDRVLSDPIWTRDIPDAISRWSEQHSDPMFITLAINRSPCGRCADRLALALHALEKRFALRKEKQYFLLAMRGFYEKSGSGLAAKTEVTSILDLQRMSAAGWVPRVLLFDNEVAEIDADLRKLPRPRGLLQALAHMRGAGRIM